MTISTLERAAPILVGVMVLASWQSVCTLWHVPPYLFPAPSDVARSLATNFLDLLAALSRTLAVTLAALAIATLAGTIIAFVFVQSRVIETSLLPYAVMLQVTPIVAIAPLVVILVKNTFWALTICATVVAIFPIISNATVGLRDVDPGLLAYFRMNKATRWQELTRLRIPSALPFFLAGLKISSGLAVIGAVVAEFVAGTGGRSAGLAFEILQDGLQLDIPKMFAALFLITMAGVALQSCVAALSRRLLAGRPGDGDVAS